MRSGKSCGARSDDRHHFLMENRGLFGKNINWVARLRTVALGQKSLEGANGDRRVEHAPSAGRLAGMAAHATAHRGKWIGLAGIAIRFLIPALCNQGDIPPGLRMHRAGLHTGEVRLQPVQIHQLAAGLHSSITDVWALGKTIFSP